MIQSIPSAAGAATGGAVGGASSLTTVGAIPYVASAGVLGQDATALFWDSANDRLGVGTAWAVDGTKVYHKNSEVLVWSSTGAYNGTPDLGLSRNAAGVVEINNGTAGTLRDLYLRRERFEAVAVTNLPAAASWPGTVQYVTDALSPVVGVAVAGGGAVPVLVWSNGTAWKVMAV